MITLFLFLNTNVFSMGERLNIEASRINKLNVIIKRVNTLYNFVNLHILQTSISPNNIAILNAKYSGLVTNGYRSTNSITFTILNNIVTFSNVVPLDSSSSPLSPIVRQIYVNNANLHENAIVNADLSISIQLKPEAIKFLSNRNILMTRFPTLQIQETEPVCDIANNGRVWYQPDVMGGYYIQYCNGLIALPAWVNMSNNLDIALYRVTLAQLNSIQPPVGTKGYIEINGGADLRECIFTGTGGTHCV